MGAGIGGSAKVSKVAESASRQSKTCWAQAVLEAASNMVEQDSHPASWVLQHFGLDTEALQRRALLRARVAELVGVEGMLALT